MVAEYAVNWQLPPGMNVYFRVGPARAFALRPMLAVFTLEIRPEERSVPLEQLTDEILARFKKGISVGGDWQQTPVESGRIGGLTFQRSAWQSGIANAPRKAHGYMYSGRDGDVFLMFLCFGFEPLHEEALETCNASIMTFRKKQAPANE